MSQYQHEGVQDNKLTVSELKTTVYSGEGNQDNILATKELKTTRGLQKNSRQIWRRKNVR